MQKSNLRRSIISRRKNESIVVDDDITIVVVEIRGDKVRLGVEAPKEIPSGERQDYNAKIQDLYRRLDVEAPCDVPDETPNTQRAKYEQFQHLLQQDDFPGALNMLRQPHSYNPTLDELKRIFIELGGLEEIAGERYHGRN